ncbi:hypothetical protein LCGC14_2572130 [marine sediment metagenome]|uniref:Uncharacterized protein n=1 Tax=marine sediment metagenome TaxID=412755 RepID=A0A0F9CT39_9ZZZZ
MSKLVEKLRSQLASITGITTEENKKEVEAIQIAADALAAKKLEDKKKAIGDDLGNQLVAEMVTTKEFEAYMTKTEAFMTIAMEHIELTQNALDSLESDINTVVKTSMDALLAQVKSKTEVPAPIQHFTEAEQIESEKEKDQAQIKQSNERERKRVLTP